MNRLATWFAPEPGSRVSEIIQQGKSPRMEAVHLLWSAWIFVTPLFDRGYTWRWAVLTALTYPVFVALFAKSMLVSRNVASRYGIGLAVLGILLVPVYSGSVSYFIYGCVSCSVNSRRLAPFLLRLLLLNSVFLLVAWQVGYPWQALVAFPLMTVIIGMVTHVERIGHEKDAALKLSHDEVRRLAATAERWRRCARRSPASAPPTSRRSWPPRACCSNRPAYTWTTASRRACRPRPSAACRWCCARRPPTSRATPARPAPAWPSSASTVD